MSSVRELETRQALQRKKLMQVIFRYLSQSGVKAELIQEPDLDSLGISVTEPAIQLKEQRIDSIRLFRARNSSCGDSGGLLRFQYKIQSKQDLPTEIASRLRAQTKTIKEGKVLGLFGGKIADVKWVGQEMAEILNQDSGLSKILLRCTQILGEMELTIDTKSSSEINISGPWFTNPDTIIALYSPDRSYEEQNCIFGYNVIDRIAQIIQEKVSEIKSEKRSEVKVYTG